MSLASDKLCCGEPLGSFLEAQIFKIVFASFSNWPCIERVNRFKENCWPKKQVFISTEHFNNDPSAKKSACYILRAHPNDPLERPFQNDPVISRFQSNSNVLYLINCGNKSKGFLSFISFIVVSQHRVQVSCTSSYKSNLFSLMQLMLHNINC